MKDVSWFHCGRCGSMFKAPVGEFEDRLCPQCGSSPSLGLQHPPQQAGDMPLPDPVVGEPATQPERPRISGRGRHRGSSIVAKVVGGWLLLLIAILVGANWLWKQDEENNKKGVKLKQERALSVADADLLERNIDSANHTLGSFLNATSPEERNQFVTDPIATSLRMTRYETQNPVVKIDPSLATFKNGAVVHLPGKRVIEGTWTLRDGRLIDAVFVEQQKEWRLDWDHYIRYSTYPWALFLADSGEAEGEFRLLARERLADERKGSDSISMVLYAPRFGYPGETGAQSPEFLVRRNTDNGKLLEKAFQMERDGKRVFGVDLPSDNPPGMIRVRVRIRRHEDASARSFELVKVIACHWYSSDDPGIEIPPQTEGK